MTRTLTALLLAVALVAQSPNPPRPTPKPTPYAGTWSLPRGDVWYRAGASQIHGRPVASDWVRIEAVESGGILPDGTDDRFVQVGRLVRPRDMLALRYEWTRDPFARVVIVHPCGTFDEPGDGL